MRNLDLDLLRTLVAIAEHDSFSAAADSLHKTQSAITQQMQRLEGLIDLPLFEKRGRNKRLSSHGEKLVTYARHMLAINDEALRSLQDSLLEGELRLGSPHDVADSILPSVLTHVARTFPRIKLEIRVDRSPHLMTALRNGELDLTVSTRFDPDFEGVVLRTSPTVWLCSADYVHDMHAPVPLVLADREKLKLLAYFLFSFFGGGIVGAIGFNYAGFVFAVPLSLLVFALAGPSALRILAR